MMITRKGIICHVASVVMVLMFAFPSMARAEIVIKYATYFTPSYKEHFIGMNKFVDVVNEKGKGKVRVEFYHSETMLKADALFSGLMMGAADAVTVPMVYWHGTLPLSQGLSLPNIWKGDMERYKRSVTMGSPIANLLNDNFAKKNLFCIFSVINDQEWLWTTNKLPNSMADIKGLKLRSSGLVPAEVIQRIGGSPTNMSSGEVFMALQRGTVDGTIATYTTVYSRALHEQLRYKINDYAFDYHGPIVIAFKKDYWDKLPGDVRKIIEDAGKEFQETIFKASDEMTKEQIVTIKKHTKFIDLSPQAREGFNEALSPMYKWWLSRGEIGEPGNKLLELIKSTEK